MKRILIADTLHESFTEIIRGAGIEPVQGHQLTTDQVMERLLPTLAVASITTTKYGSNFVNSPIG